MNTKKAFLIEYYRTLTNLRSLRETLLNHSYVDRLEQPLSHWAMREDGQLSTALLGRTVKDLLDSPLEELSATYRIGPTKMRCLIRLLLRVRNGLPSAGIPAECQQPATERHPAADGGQGKKRRAAGSESEWQRSAEKSDQDRQIPKRNRRDGRSDEELAQPVRPNRVGRRKHQEPKQP
jgi:hypothetical protein